MRLVAALLGIVVAGGAVVAAEKSAPFRWKPSIVLRASTGDLPVRDLDVIAQAEMDKAKQAAAVRTQTLAERERLVQSLRQGRAHIEALARRIEQKTTQISHVQ